MNKNTGKIRKIYQSENVGNHDGVVVVNTTKC